jgi:integrase
MNIRTVSLVKPNRHKRSPYFYLKITFIDGKSTTRSLRTDNKKTAHAILHNYKQRIALAAHDVELPENSHITLFKFAEKYIEHIERQPDRSPATIKTDRQVLKIFLRYFGDISLQRLTPESLRKFENDLLTKPSTKRAKLSPGTVARNRRHLKAALSWAERTGLIKSNPAKKLERIKMPASPKKYLSQSEIAAVRKSIEQSKQTWLLDVFNFELWTGARGGEVIQLKLDDIDLQDRVLFFTGKGKKTRPFPITPKMLALLEPRMRGLLSSLPAPGHISSLPGSARRIALTRWNEKKIFWEYSQVSSLSHALQKHFRRAGIIATQHSLRHTFATHFLNSLLQDLGANADHRILSFVLSDLMGHSQIDTTRIYAKTKIQMLNELVQKHTE